MNMIKLFILTMIMPSNLFARQFPEPEQPRYQIIEFPPLIHRTQLPIECTSNHKGIKGKKPCLRNADLEISLEQEYWAIVQNTNIDAMTDWLTRTKSYLNLSQSAYQDRLNMLSGFGEVMIFRSQNFANSTSIRHVLSAISHIQKSLQRSPQVPSALSMDFFLKAFFAYALGKDQLGQQLIEKLRALPKEYDHYGSEGYLVAAFAYMALKDKEMVKLGLDLLQDCLHPYCQRTTSLAPFKMMGNAIAIAEAEAYRGMVEKAAATLNQAYIWGQEHNFPKTLLTRLIQYKEELLNPQNGLIVQWNRGQSLGSIRLPFGPSQSAESCSMCHAGSHTPQHYYTWKTL